MICLSKRFIFIFTALILVCLFSGCQGHDSPTTEDVSSTPMPSVSSQSTFSENAPPNTEQSYLIGGNYGGDPAPDVFARYFATTKEIKQGEDLSVHFCYSLPSFHQGDHEFTNSAISCKVIMSNYYIDENSRYSLIKATTIKNTDNYSAASLVKHLHPNINHYFSTAVEEITIPSDWFSENHGQIGWSVTFELPFEGQDYYTIEKGGTEFYYIKENNTIKLFSTAYDFENYLNSKGK